MCGLIFHKDPSTELHMHMALVSPLKIQRKYHMPWIGFIQGRIQSNIVERVRPRQREALAEGDVAGVWGRKK